MPQVLTEKILFIQTAFIGDLFLSIPTLKKIKSLHPKSSLTLLCKKNLGEFFLKNKIVDKVIEVDKKNSTSLKEAFIKTKEFSPDIIISAHQSFRTALWVWRLAAKEKTGFHHFWTSWAYTKTIKRDLKLHDALRQLSLLGDVKNLDPSELYPVIKIEKNNEYYPYQGAIAIAPGSQWATKKWTEQGFIEVIEFLLNNGKKVVLVGGQEELDLGKIIQSKIKNQNFYNFIGKTTIYQLAQLLSECSGLISNDSGAMHVATSIGTPVLAIFGPTVKAQGYTPWSTQSKIVEVDLPCRPCGAHGHQVCPIKTHDCMKKISSSTVVSALQSMGL